MTNSITSTGNAKKQKGARGQQDSQPSTNPGQRLSDQQAGKTKAEKPDGGAQKGARSVR